MTLEWRQFNAAVVEEIHRAGREAFVSVVGPNDNQPALAALAAAGVDYIETDQVDVARFAVRRANAAQ